MIDEINPTFRTIQNRIKEVFNYRIDPIIWTMFVDAVSCRQKRQQPLLISHGLQMKIIFENQKYEYHYADKKGIRIDGMISPQSFVIKECNNIKKDSVVELLYFSHLPEWQSYDCENLLETNNNYIELQKFLVSFF